MQQSRASIPVVCLQWDPIDLYITLIQCAETGANMTLPTEKAANKIKDAVGSGAKQAREKGAEVKGEASEYAGKAKGEAAEYAGKGKGKAEEALGEAKQKTK
jgi:hypothetical protein